MKKMKFAVGDQIKLKNDKKGEVEGGRIFITGEVICTVDPEEVHKIALRRFDEKGYPCYGIITTNLEGEKQTAWLYSHQFELVKKAAMV